MPSCWTSHPVRVHIECIWWILITWNTLLYGFAWQVWSCQQRFQEMILYLLLLMGDRICQWLDWVVDSIFKETQTLLRSLCSAYSRLQRVPVFVFSCNLHSKRDYNRMYNFCLQFVPLCQANWALRLTTQASTTVLMHSPGRQQDWKSQNALIFDEPVDFILCILCAVVVFASSSCAHSAVVLTCEFVSIWRV